MTTTTRDSSESYAYLDASRREGNLLTVAIGVAVAVHLVAIWIPLPKRTTPPTPPVVAPEYWVRVTELPPPPPPDARPPRVRQPEPFRRTIPIPAPDASIEPLPEEIRELLRESVEIDLSAIDLPPVPPAQTAPALVEEGHAGLTLPIGIVRASPSYPATAIAIRAEAEVLLEAIVDASGKVVDLRVLTVTGSPDLGFSDAAIEAVSGWTYAPGSIDGRPVAVRLTVRVSFNLR